MVAALIYSTLSERNERKLILLILSELSESSFRSGTRDVVLPGWLVYKERLGRDAVSTADRNTHNHYWKSDYVYYKICFVEVI